jgi:hypothetical protein
VALLADEVLLRAHIQHQDILFLGVETAPGPFDRQHRALRSRAAGLGRKATAASSADAIRPLRIRPSPAIASRPAKHG